MDKLTAGEALCMVYTTQIYGSLDYKPLQLWLIQ